jgi:hypothetical protein
MTVPGLMHAELERADGLWLSRVRSRPDRDSLTPRLAVALCNPDGMRDVPMPDVKWVNDVTHARRPQKLCFRWWGARGSNPEPTG